jgi:hypothetical protein
MSPPALETCLLQDTVQRASGQVVGGFAGDGDDTSPFRVLELPVAASDPHEFPAFSFDHPQYVRNLHALKRIGRGLLAGAA